ncbi:MAG TPA: DUF1549 and DUF1553 domain-containing protein [Gemmatales bacterium]|nr:DUF1549 and DUF1553 domain-containing protein [Gemmatales bacterium]
MPKTKALKYLCTITVGLLVAICLFSTPTKAETPKPIKRDPSVVAKQIDSIIDKALVDSNVPASGLSDDAEFARRLSLDLRGRIPTPERVVKFIADKDPAKRQKLIEDFLDDPEFGEHFGIIWYHRLVKKTMDNAQVISYKFEEWLEKEFNKNTPWDQLVKNILMSEGERDKNPATVFYLAHSEGNKQPEVQPARVVATASQMFMGVRLECCECHNHPFDDNLKQKDFWGIAAFFNGMHANHTAKKDEATPVILERFTNRAPAKRKVQDGQREPASFGEIVIPDTKGKTEKARYLHGETPSLSQSKSPRLNFIEWLTSKENPYFARGMANKMWANFFGKGIVEPVDDMRDLSKATHPEVLELLAKEFADSGYDIKHLARCIVSTQAYQRSSSPLPKNKDDKVLYSHVPIKVLTADMLYDSLQVVLHHAPVSAPEKTLRKMVAAKAKGRGTARDQFRDFFHAEADDDAGVTEEYGHGIPQVLKLMNDSQMNNITVVITDMMKNSKTPEQMIQTLYLRILSRYATAKEITRMKKYLEGDVMPQRAYRDMFWALMNSSEFMFNH